MSRPAEPDLVCMLQGTIVIETAKALLIEQDGAEHWLPKSQVMQQYMKPNGDGLFTLWAKKWICDKNQIPYDDEACMELIHLMSDEVQAALEKGEQYESEEARIQQELHF